MQLFTSNAFATIVLTALMAVVPATVSSRNNDSDSELTQSHKYASMASATLDSLYVHYGIAGENLLRENYPYDESYKATYLAGEDTNKQNPYSYLWPFSGTLTAARAMYDATHDWKYIDLLEKRVMPGLSNYYDTRRTPAAYASYVNKAPKSDRFYDDNIWLGIDFTDLYAATGHKPYLDKACEIWRFIKSGTDKKLGGGIYWCEQKKHSKNTCSNAPGTVYALKLFKATADSTYLDEAKALYDWTKTNLQDSTDLLYFDHKTLRGKIGRAKFAYNSGQMLQAAALLYEITGSANYLDDAKALAKASHERFFGQRAIDSNGAFPLFNNRDIWFTAVMMRGFGELYKHDGNRQYMNDFIRNIDYAWTHMRDPQTGLFNEDWTGEKKNARKWLLTQAAMVEMMALASEYASGSLNASNGK